MPAPPQLVLASASPRRKELFATFGLPFTVRPGDVDESARRGEPVDRLVERLSAEKAAAARPAHGELVLAADTLVAVDAEVLGKPADAADAARMLRLLSGRTHEVLTGVTWVDGTSAARASAVERTRVTFATLQPHEIDWYVASREPLDKAGAYGIQGKGGVLVTRVEGNYDNVVGLPRPLVLRLARALGHDLLAWAP